MRFNTEEASIKTPYEQALETLGIPNGVELNDDQRIDVYIEVTKIRNELDRQSKAAGQALSILQPDIVDHFSKLGQQKVTRRGKTVYIAREIWPKIVSEDLIESLGPDATKSEIDAAKAAASDRALKALASDPETAHLVKESYNSQSLRSFILNDCEESPDGNPILPEHLSGAITFAEQFKAKVTNG